MDKTGTLTDGKFVVRNVIDFTDETDILQIMAALEGSSTHPIAQSIVNAAQPLKSLKVEAIENIPGLGLKVKSINTFIKSLIINIFANINFLMMNQKLPNT
ncbi:Zinc-transporting ATPase [Lactococcus lactis]|nr:Zinc-transporting ATPase [Lactococcus lactis]